MVCMGTNKRTLAKRYENTLTRAVEEIENAIMVAPIILY